MDAEMMIRRIIEHIRPFIMADGGDITFVSYLDNIVTIALSGACMGCMAIDTTLNDGVKAWIMEQVPEVKDVVLYQPEESDETNYDFL